jgi:hypothetical protein
MAALPICLVCILTGQSVRSGDPVGGAGPFPATQWWGLASVAFANMGAGVPVADIRIAETLLAAGQDCIIINISQGSTSSPEWTPPSGSMWLTFEPKFQAALAALAAERLAGTVFKFVRCHDQGEREAINGPVLEVSNWAANYALQQAAIEAIVQQHVPDLITWTRIPLTGGIYSTEIRAQQTLAAGNTTPVNRDSVAYDVDGIHPTYAGYSAYGIIQANAILELDTMGAPSTYAKNVLIDHFRNKATHSPAATHYLHLYADAGQTVPLTGGTASGYAAVSKTNNTTTWPNAASRIKASGVDFTFPTPGGTWPDVCGWKLTDNATEGAGNVLASDSHDPVPVTVVTGPISYAVGAITITASAGGLVDAVVHGLLNLMFGGTAYTQLATTYGTYSVGDMQSGGVVAGSRVAMTQATTWGAAAAGQASSIAAVTLAQQVTATHWAEYDAAAAGNLLLTAARPAATGAGGTILIGQLKTTLT